MVADAIVSATSLAIWGGVLSMLLGGCCANVFYLETLFRNTPSSSHLITFAQFVFVSILGLPSVVSVRRSSSGLPCLRPLKTPFPYHRLLVTVVLFFTVTAANNLALGYNVPMPVHIIFRSGSLIASCLLNVLILKKSYPRLCYVAISMITVGVATTTITAATSTTASMVAPLHLAHFFIGIGLLSTALLLTCVLGIYQEETYRQYGAHWRPALFYSHAFALPLFALVWPQIKADAAIFGDTRVVFGVPEGWHFLLFNTATQYICVASVHKLGSIATSLTINLVLTLRKFASLMISMLYFGKALMLGPTIGGALVFAGTAMYVFAVNRDRSKPKQS